MKNKRPDGSAQIGIGWLLLVLSFVLFLIASGANTTDFLGRPDVAAIQRRSIQAVMAGAIFSISLVLLSVGWVVRAISFLPGREVEADALADEEVSRTTMHPTIGALLIVGVIAAILVAVRWLATTSN